MFWGLIMEPQRRYTQKVKKAFHISMAALDLSTSSEEPAQVMCGFQGRNYLLCTLRKPDMLQCNLDLNFDVGSEVSFASNGACHVHLTGYLQEDVYEEVEEEAEEEEKEEIVASSKKRTKKSLQNGRPAKKSKVSEEVEEEEGEEEENENKSEGSDSEPDVYSLLKTEIDSDDEDDSDAEIEEEEVSEEEEESSVVEEEEEEVEVTVVRKPKASLNGVVNEASDKTKEVQKEQKKEKKSLGKEDKTPKKKDKKVLQGKVLIEDLKEGNGQLAKPGKFVKVYYEGRLKNNNKLFDSTTSGPGFKFRLGNGEVIKGWDVGLNGMKVGGKRRITCPPNMAYGTKGSPPAIPSNATLVFDVELKGVM